MRIVSWVNWKFPTIYLILGHTNFNLLSTMITWSLWQSVHGPVILDVWSFTLRTYYCSLYYIISNLQLDPFGLVRGCVIHGYLYGLLSRFLWITSDWLVFWECHYCHNRVWILNFNYLGLIYMQVMNTWNSFV